VLKKDYLRAFEFMESGKLEFALEARKKEEIPN
jgi:hypothetical protein